MGDFKAFTGGDINVVTIKLMPRCKTNSMNDNIDVVPVFSQFFENIVNFFIAGNVARENQVTTPALSELLYPRFEFFILVSKSQLGAFASKGFWDESSGRYLHWTWIWETFHNASGTPETIWGWEASPSIARELTVDLESQTLVFNPVSVQAPRLYNWFAINLKF